MKRFHWVLIAALALGAGVGCHKQQAKVNEATPGNAGSSSSSSVPSQEKGLPDVHSERLATAYFDFNQSNLRSDARDTLKKDAQLLKQNPDVAIRIEGHCDERGSTQYNLALGERRASAARKYLMNLGVSAARIDTVSYGKERPADPGHDDTAWAKNRRVEMSVTGGATPRVSSSY